VDVEEVDYEGFATMFEREGYAVADMLGCKVAWLGSSLEEAKSDTSQNKFLILFPQEPARILTLC
jgi:hypothetical protein